MLSPVYYYFEILSQLKVGITGRDEQCNDLPLDILVAAVIDHLADQIFADQG